MASWSSQVGVKKVVLGKKDPRRKDGFYFEVTEQDGKVCITFVAVTYYKGESDHYDEKRVIKGEGSSFEEAMTAYCHRIVGTAPRSATYDDRVAEHIKQCMELLEKGDLEELFQKILIRSLPRGQLQGEKPKKTRQQRREEKRSLQV